MAALFAPRVKAYATGCYYPEKRRHDLPAMLEGLRTEAKGYRDAGFDLLKVKIGLLDIRDDYERAVEAAEKGCDGTVGMEASLGRSVYVGGEDIKRCPDPGAFGLAAFLKGLL